MHIIYSGMTDLANRRRESTAIDTHRSAGPGLIDVHTHVIDTALSDLRRAYPQDRWPRVECTDDIDVVLMFGESLHRKIDHRSWSPEAGIADMDRDGVACCGQHAIARRGGLARFADIADQCLDPAEPTPERCFALGGAVAQAVEDADLRVALVASSSWSHACLTDKTWHITPDTAADRRLYQLFVDHDYVKWRATASRHIVDSGQHEMLNWFCLTAAVDELGPSLEWSKLITTGVFNSNKCFAVFKEGK